MKHSTETLLLAAAIRPRATELRAKARAAAKTQAGLDFKEAPRHLTGQPSSWEAQEQAALTKDEALLKAGKDFDHHWLATHPLSTFVGSVMQELEEIAEAIVKAQNEQPHLRRLPSDE